MKVLYLITSGDLGGAQKYVLDLASHFGGAVASGTEQQHLTNECQKLGIQYHPLKHLKRNINLLDDLLAIWELRNLILKTQPELLHTNSSKAGLIGCLAGVLASTPVVFTAHGFQYLEPMSRFKALVYKLLHKIISRFSVFIITVSEQDRSQALQDKVIKKERSQTVYYGIQQVNFLQKTEARNRLALPQQSTCIGTIANFYKTKGLDTLLEAFATICTKRTNLTLIIIGDGPERDNLESLISTLNLKNKVILKGQIKDAGTLLKAFDIFVLASRKEGLPYVLLESSRAGLAKIVTEVGGNREAAGPGAIYVPKENPKALAEALDKVLDSHSLQVELGQAGLAYSIKFTKEAMLTNTNHIYERVMHQS